MKAPFWPGPALISTGVGGLACLMSSHWWQPVAIGALVFVGLLLVEAQSVSVRANNTTHGTCTPDHLPADDIGADRPFPQHQPLASESIRSETALRSTRRTRGRFHQKPKTKNPK